VKLFVGLGNPGTKYARHRHNVGFMALDRIADRHDFGVWRRRFQGETAEGELGEERVLLLKPTTYMNDSGRAVGEAQRFFKIPLEEIYVFHDEVDLAPLKLKVKTGGGSAGHNGLRSISSHIGPDYKRVRIGVGHPGQTEKVPDYVLDNFAKVELEWLDPLLEAIAAHAQYLNQDKKDCVRFLTNVARLVREPGQTGVNKPSKDTLSTKQHALTSPSKPRPHFRREFWSLDNPKKWHRSFRKAGREMLRAGWHELKRNYASFKRSRSKATYIAVTGSSAKTTTVALLSHILSAKAKVKTQLRTNHDVFTWKTLADVTPEHDYVILELGTHGPGDIPKMAKVVRPDIAIVTLVNLEHFSAFRSKDAVAKEKGSLVEAVQPSGLAILNKDDPRVLAMSDSSKARVVTFGKSEADYSQDKLISTELGRLIFTLNHRDRQIRLETRLSGAHNCLAVSAAAACALELGVSEATVMERVASFEPVFGRMSIHATDQGPTFILDCVKAPYETIPLALEVLRDCVATRKRFVLGNISDYAGKGTPKYRNTYRAALDVADQVMFVGENAHKSKASNDEIEAGRFVAFYTLEQLSHYIKSTAIAGEIILIKGSGNLHLERVVLDWEMEIKCWENNCGVEWDCLRCGLYAEPFTEHPADFRQRPASRKLLFVPRPIESIFVPNSKR